jgi:hypothetical protein
MPNIYTPHPDIVLNLLRDAGFQCGIEAKRILVTCPTAQFCAHYGQQYYGELCVRSVHELAGGSLIPGAVVLAIALVAWTLAKKF